MVFSPCSIQVGRVLVWGLCVLVFVWRCLFGVVGGVVRIRCFRCSRGHVRRWRIVWLKRIRTFLRRVLVLQRPGPLLLLRGLRRPPVQRRGTRRSEHRRIDAVPQVWLHGPHEGDHGSLSCIYRSLLLVGQAGSIGMEPFWQEAKAVFKLVSSERLGLCVLKRNNNWIALVGILCKENLWAGWRFLAGHSSSTGAWYYERWFQISWRNELLWQKTCDFPWRYCPKVH